MAPLRLVHMPTLTPEQLAAAVNALPSDPHDLIISIWQVDYSSIAQQLQTIPELAAAEFAFGEKMYGSGSRINLARVNNPTRQMVIDIYAGSLGRVVPSKVLASVESVKWDYGPDVSLDVNDVIGTMRRASRLPSSKVVLTPTEVNVSYGIRRPEYLPSLEAALENTGMLKVNTW